MTSYRNIPPRILWGSTLQNAFDVAWALDNVQAGDTPRDGSTQVQGPSGVEDAWTIGTDYVLQGDVRWIPPSDILTPRASGWDGATGVRAFLQWARDKNQLLFLPDSRNLVLYPFMQTDANSDGIVDGFTKSDSTPGGATFTLDLGVPGGAQKVALPAGGNTSGASTFSGVSQAIPGILPGEVLTLSVDYQTAGLANGVVPAIAYHFLDANGSQITAPGSNQLAAASFTRVAYTQTSPAGTASAQVLFFLVVPPNTGTLSAGTAWVKNMLLRRNGVTDTTILDTPQVLSYLVQPMADPPPSESDGTRKMTLRLRNATTAFNGY